MTQTDMQIRPIRTEQDHAAAIARIEELMDSSKNAAQRDELEILATLVQAYESIHFPIDRPEPLAAIKIRMEQKRLTRKDLEPMIGSRARVSEVLSGKRPLTLAMVRRLSQGLGLSADTLIRGTQSSASLRTKSPRKPTTASKVRSAKSASVAS